MRSIKLTSPLRLTDGCPRETDTHKNEQMFLNVINYYKTYGFKKSFFLFARIIYHTAYKRDVSCTVNMFSDGVRKERDSQIVKLIKDTKCYLEELYVNYFRSVVKFVFKKRIKSIDYSFLLKTRWISGLIYLILYHSKPIDSIIQYFNFEISS